jgi:hypothetical protein
MHSEDHHSPPATLGDSAPVPQVNIDAMSGVEFEAFVGEVLRHNGYLVEATKVTGDFGVDLVARRGVQTIAVQCKRRRRPVTTSAVEEVLAGAAVYQCTSTMIVSNQSFTSRAVVLAVRNNCMLIDSEKLWQLARGWRPETNEGRLAWERDPAVNAGKRSKRHRAEEMTMFERFSRNARVSVVLAQEEARELNAEEIRPEHLLVGVLQSAGRDLSSVLGGFGLTADVIRDRLAKADSPVEESFDDDAESLRWLGIDLRAVRDSVDRTFGAGTFDNALRKPGRRRRRRGHIPFTKPAKKVLELSLREALAHKDNWIGCEHIMLGILRGGDTFTMGLITERVDASQLRGAIADLLDEAA